jgi:hypothetical protein
MTPFISSRVRKLDVGISGYTDTDSVLNVTGKVSVGTAIDFVPYDSINNGTLRLEGSAGTLFSISNNLTNGSIFSVNDATGVPSLDVNANGTILLAPFGQTEYIGIGKVNPTEKVDVEGSIKLSGDIFITDNNEYSYNIQFVTPTKDREIVIPDATGTVGLVAGSTGMIQYNDAGKLAASGNFVYANDNVGIGTQSPTESLDISGTQNKYIQITSTNSQRTGLLFSNTSPGVGKIYYNHDDNTLRIETNSLERVRIDGSGRVGIGTSSPDVTLHLGTTPAGAGSAGVIGFGDISNYRVAEIEGYRENGSFAGSLIFKTQPSVSSGSSGAERMRITSAGNVGIGTSSPGTNFHLNNNPSWVAPTGGIPNNTQVWISSSTFTGLGIQGSSAGASYVLFSDENDGDVGYISYQHTDDSLRFGVNAQERLRIDSTGNVGIGTTNPQYKLDIVGTLRVSETTRIGDVIDIVPYDNLNNGTLSFEGSAGQLFSITNNLTSGSIFAVNDVSGIPSLDIDADGTISISEFSGNVFFAGLSTDTVFVGTNNNTNTNNSRLVVNGGISETVNGIQYPVVSQVNIGTDPNQIPLNQFLGSMAFADFPFLQTTTSTDGATASITVNAESTDLYSQIADYTTDVVYDILNLTSGREIKLYLRNTNASARTITIRASATNTGFANVNLAPGAGTMGAASTSTISLAATSGTTLIYVANIGGNIVGGILA